MKLDLYKALVAVAGLATVLYILAIGRPRNSADPQVAYLLAANGWADVALLITMQFILFGAAVAWWVLALVLALQAGVYTWRAVFAVHARRANRDEGN